MFPYELKDNLSEYITSKPEFIKSAKKWLNLPEIPTIQDYEAVIDSIYEVLYKFSYQKLKVFCKVPELAMLYSKFFKTLDSKVETYYNVAQEVIDYWN